MAEDFPVRVVIKGYNAAGEETYSIHQWEIEDVKRITGLALPRHDVVKLVLEKQPRCLNCKEDYLVPHNSAGKRQYKDYPNLLICPKCWHKYHPNENGKLVLVTNPRKY